jgi:hypothetical protein
VRANRDNERCLPLCGAKVSAPIHPAGMIHEDAEKDTVAK